jgi:hypothetical protein
VGCCRWAVAGGLSLAPLLFGQPVCRSMRTLDNIYSSMRTEATIWSTCEYEDAYIHTYIHTYIRMSVCIYMYTYIHTCNVARYAAEL